MKLDWLHTRAWGIVVGATITAMAAMGYALGWFDRLWLSALDWQFRYVNRIEASPDIVMIDINDYALERVHRWPWPRRLDADLIDVLHELGASAILLDLVFSEPMAPRIEHPALDPDYDVDPATEILGDVSPENAIRDDDELAGAMQRAGCAYPAMYCRLSNPRQSVPELLKRAKGVLAADPGMSVTQFDERMGKIEARNLEGLYRRAQLLRLLEEDFTFGLEEASARLGAKPADMDPHFADAKKMQARRLVREHLDRHPQADFAAVRAEFLPQLGPDEESADREDLLRAFRTERAWRVIAGRVPDIPETLIGRIPNGWDVTPALDKFAEGSRYCGFVTFEKDPEGGVLRRIPLVINVEGKLIKQLGFAVVCDRLGIDDASFGIDQRGFLTFADSDGRQRWSVALDEDGMALMNWHIDRAHPTWEHSFAHLAVARLMEVPANRRTMRRNEELLALTTARAVETQLGAETASYADYARLVRRRNQLRAGGGASSQPASDERAALDEKINVIERSALEWLKFSAGSIQGAEPTSAEETELFNLVRSLEADLVQGGLRRQVEEKNDRLRVRNEELLGQLRPLIAGKMCFVGYTAAAVADMVNTPVFEHMPGVMAHSNLVNTVVQNRFPRVASTGVNVALIALAGLLVTLMTSGHGPWVSLVSVLLLLALLIGGGLLLFNLYAFQVIVIVAAIAVFVCWAFITLYRQLTEERQKRNLAKALGRSTSPAIAAEIIRRPGQLDLSPRPQVVTCYFSDLQGFTDISERLGPADTQSVLNRYLERMSEVLVPNHAFSKFMGDGIFAFFNAPLLPVERHERVACEVALACGEALEALKREESQGPNAEVFAELVMRAGIHSGTAYVGEYGSENQTDYTCIGDTVNLAARLEPANKVFGTGIMVSQTCRDGAGPGFEFRPLGKLQVKGKERAVPVFELLGRTGQVAEQRLDFARTFAGAVGLFQERRFVEALRVLESCGDGQAHDAAVELYLREIKQHIESPPPVEWNQAIRLTTK